MRPRVPEGRPIQQLATVSEKLWGKSEQLATVSKQLMSASKQLEQKSEQLRSIFKQKAGMAYRRMCFALLKNHIVANGHCACRARCGARPATPNYRATLGGGAESDWASGEAG